MKITSECVTCLIRRAIYEANEVNADEKTMKLLINKAGRIVVDEFSPNTPSYVIATHMHRKVYEILNNEDPYKRLKKISNETAFKLYETAKEFVMKSDDKLSAAALVSVIGNIMDFGIRGSGKVPEDLKDYFFKEIKNGLYLNDIHKAESFFNKGILYFTDNCGEIVFDKIFLENLRDKTPFIGLVVKGKPILTDALKEDAVSYGLDKIVDKIYTTENDFVGFNYDDLSEELKNNMNKMLIISKGMANYEVFSEFNFSPIVYMLRTKCKPVAESMGLEKNKNIVKLV